VNGPEVLSHFRHQLAARLASHQAPCLQPPRISPWLAMAMLQKGIRRGRAEVALLAAATLLRDAPDRLWRRLCGIAFEDIGVADLDSIAMVVTAVIGGRRARADLGGEWQVASFIVQALSTARKCRSADDLLMAAQSHPAYATRRSEWARLPSLDLLEIAAHGEDVIERGLALWFVFGTDRRQSKPLPARRGQPRAAFDWMCEAGFPHTVVVIAQEGFNRGAEMLAPFVALLAPETGRDTAVIADDESPPETMIAAVPSWALDQYSWEGKAAISRFCDGVTDSARWVRDRIAPTRRTKFLGEVVFRVEGSLLSDRLRWPVGDELRRKYDADCLGVEPEAAREIMGLMLSDIPALNEARADLFGGPTFTAQPLMSDNLASGARR
jgi:hypothetical protein